MRRTVCFLAALAGVLCLPAQAGLITNGGFETGLTGWARNDQTGSDSTFLVQTGTLSPVNGFTVPPPPGGIRAAMTDSGGPGSHVLYQDFVVPNSITAGYFITFSLYINNGHGAGAFFAPALLDFATPTLNQQARVDIIKTSADPFSVAAADVLQNLYQTAPGNPLVSGYTSIARDITALLQTNQGQTLRLRFAEVDNVAPFNLGVDNVDINAAPEPSCWIMVCGAMVGLGLMRRRRA
jgi:hypothetical protein